ncbi:DUF4105 domain-containing protein [Luteimonas sp. MJ293]|uniref:Lnb N-terminal periplasmic domain-containing protein n=1 Tax=Luteimonas sp. MJ146 TaxID=3129240 RepID=UPI0031BA54BC
MTDRLSHYWRAAWLAATRFGILLIAAWGALALWFQMPRPALWLLLPVWSLCALAALAAPWLPRRRRSAHLLSAAALVLLLAWWTTLQPSHDRVWADDVARLLEPEVEGSRVVLHNVRNFDWRTEQDYDVRWETRGYDLDQLATADLILSYWMGPKIAHTLVSFGFDDGRQLVFSLEIRKEQHEAFSAIGGFFRQFETVLVAADENDIVRTRTNARGEDVYLYRLDVERDALHRLFLGYLDEAESIRRAPRFYNTLTSNCTTIIYQLARGIAPALPLDYRLLLSGYFAEYVHDVGALVPGHDYAQLQAAGRISDRARAFTGPPEDFPEAIRAGVPGIKEPARP